MPNGQIHALNKSGVQPARKAQPLQGCFKRGICPQAHDVRDLYQLPSLVPFLDLAIDQTRRYLPSVDVSPAMSPFLPLSKMSCQRIEVHIEAITRENRQAVGSQDLPERVDKQMCHVLRTGTEMKHRQNLCEGIDR